MTAVATWKMAAALYQAYEKGESNSREKKQERERERERVKGVKNNKILRHPHLV